MLCRLKRDMGFRRGRLPEGCIVRVMPAPGGPDPLWVITAIVAGWQRGTPITQLRQEARDEAMVVGMGDIGHACYTEDDTIVADLAVRAGAVLMHDVVVMLVWQADYFKYGEETPTREIRRAIFDSGEEAARWAIGHHEMGIDIDGAQVVRGDSVAESHSVRLLQYRPQEGMGRDAWVDAAMGEAEREAWEQLTK